MHADIANVLQHILPRQHNAEFGIVPCRSCTSPPHFRRRRPSRRKGSSFSRLHHLAQPRKTTPQIRHSCSDPDPRCRRHPDHPSKHSSTVRSASASTLPVTRTCPFGGLISIVPEVHRVAAQRTCPDLFEGISETGNSYSYNSRSLDRALPGRPSRYFLRRQKTWLAFTACRCATRATDAPASKVSSTIRRFFSTIAASLPLCKAANFNRSDLGCVHLFTRGHFSMCPQRASSLLTHAGASSRRFTPVPYKSYKQGHETSYAD